MRFPNRDDFEGKWIFIHASYSYDLNMARFWSHFSYSNQALGNVWASNNKRSPPPTLKFRLGTSANHEVAGYNLQYRNVKVFHGLASANYFLDT